MPSQFGTKRDGKHYYPFGMVMPGRNFSSDSYRYGFNAQEKVGEGIGVGSNYDFSSRIFNPSLGVYLTIDPLYYALPGWSPFKFGFDNPIKYLDENGEFEVDGVTAKNYRRLDSYLKNISQKYSSKPERFRQEFKKFSGLSDSQIKTMLTYGSGPRISVKDISIYHPILNPRSIKQNAITIQGNDEGKTINANPDLFLSSDMSGVTEGKGLIILNLEVVDLFEKANNMKEHQIAETLLESTIFHEGIHIGEGIKHAPFQTAKEHGKEFEKSIYGDDVDIRNAEEISKVNLTPLPTKPIKPLQ